MTVEDTTSYKLSVSTGAAATKELEDEIVRFDTILEEIQESMTSDLRAYESIVTCRDYIFRMREVLRGCEVVHFATGNVEGDI